MKLILAFILLPLIAIASLADNWKWSEYGLPQSALKTCTPDTRGKSDSWWIPLFKSKLKQPHNDLLFIGDSITDLWTYPSDHKYPGGLDTWNKKYKDIATNFGITGDKTQTVLWRLTEGKSLENYYPKHIIILIGINNLLQNDTSEDTFAGIKAIVEYLRKIRPDAKIMLLGIFPCHEKPNTPIREKIIMTNKKIRSLADYKHIYFADIGGTFLEKEGKITTVVMRDLLHLSPQGYEMWASAMEPYLKAFLADNGGDSTAWNK
ncbi:MAG: GDSL-type esterase/lipase family protein [Paludibacteraceae bacterium]